MSAEAAILIAKFKQKLIKAKLCSPQEFLPCNEVEIQTFIDAQKIKRLPDFYLEFLRTMGRGAGDFMGGTDFLCPALRTLKQSAEDLLAEQGHAKLPPSAFVFSIHQGYQFNYFLTEGDSINPPTYYYIESDNTFTCNHESISEYFNKSADRQIRSRLRKS